MAQEQLNTVNEIMTGRPICCLVNDPLKDVIYQMAQAEVNALLVVDEKNATRGVISQTDILEHYAGIAGLTAGDVMDRELVTIQADEPIEKAAHLMVETKALRLIVPDRDRPEVTAGIVSASDIIRALVDVEFRNYLPVQL
jgi:predicted transcriptional regulator